LFQRCMHMTIFIVFYAFSNFPSRYNIINDKKQRTKKIRTICLFEEVRSEQSSILAYKPFSLVLIEKLKYSILKKKSIEKNYRKISKKIFEYLYCKIAR
jgi:hypothetical protein